MFFNILKQIVNVLATWEIKVFIKPFLKAARLLLYFLSLMTSDYQQYPRQISVNGGEVFDYIIVGGGTAGCVLANRLTENPDTNVLLIEAGDIPSIASNILGFFSLLDYSSEEWGYFSENDGYSSQNLKEKRVHMTAGKVLGGTSSLSYSVYVRGAKADYDRWEQLGNEGWGWNDVLPYFKRSEYIADMEIYRSNSSSLHGKHGPMKVRRPEWDDETTHYLEGFRQNGGSILLDINGFKNLGYALCQFYVDDHYKQSTAITYLKPVSYRKNLKLLLNSLVTKIIVNENKEAIGVEVLLKSRKKVFIKARKEVLLSAGTFNSPKLLMLSGIGPKDHLQENNIDVIVDAQAVGQNFADSIFILTTFTGKLDFLQSFKNNIQFLTDINIYGNPVFIGHEALNRSQEYADYQVNILPVPPASLLFPVICSSVLGLSDEACISMYKGGFLQESVLTAHSIMHPESRGSVELSCSDSEAPPVIRTKYYSNPEDLERHAKYVMDYVNVVNTDHFKSFDSRIVKYDIKQCSHLKSNTLAYWKCFILNTAGTMWNFSGTCIMGPEGVVDPSGKVRGVKYLRVVDASIIPSPVSGNLQSVVVMIAEKIAAMIKDDIRNTDEEMLPEFQ